MKLLFWVSTIILLISEYFTIQGFINIYFKNYNGGPQSSSGSIIYPMILGFFILIAGLGFYYYDKIKIATLIMSLPIVYVLGLSLIRFLPYLLGKKMQ